MSNVLQKILHRADERGSSDHGWLQSKFSFSFAEWYDPRRMGFGALRVINDDTIAPLGKFGMHPHNNFEIITIPLSGAVTHEDSMGNKGEVQAGEVQAMSAGRGVVHSECNASATEELRLFQIWIEPNRRDAAPRYAQKRFDEQGRKNKWQVLVSGDGAADSLAIYQDARIMRADLEQQVNLSYQVSREGNGVYVLVIEGKVRVDGTVLHARDAIGLSVVHEFSVAAMTPASLLLFDVPL